MEREIKKLRKEILDKSHLNCVKDLARKYFSQSSIDFSCLTIADFEKLRSLIQIEIDKLLADNSYRMIPELKVKPKIQKNKDGIFLRISWQLFFRQRGNFFFYMSA